MTGITPSGRHLGRIKDKEDKRDHLFRMAHAHAMLQKPPPRVDLSAKFPAAFDQGEMSACGPNCASALMSFYYPAVKQLFSRLQIYIGVRSIENTVREDSGVETRDLFRVLQLTGAATEDLWPYEKSKLKEQPPDSVFTEAEKYTISSFARLQSEDEYLACLADGHPFVLGIEVFESIDSADLARTGVMPMPDVNKEQAVGGHDVTVVGFELDFKNSEVFKKSGVDPARVSDHALKIRNSWGSWGLAGHFWMPMPYAVDSVLGNDSWTARL